MNNNQFKKSVTKQEMADLLGITTRQLATWCNEVLYKELLQLRYDKKSKYFTPRQAQYIYDELSGGE